MTLPNKLKIGYYDYMIEHWDSNLATAAQRYGECDRLNNVIRINLSLPEQHHKEVLLHEIVHAIWSERNLPSSLEEEIVSQLSVALAAVFKDNPELVRYLDNAQPTPSV